MWQVSYIMTALELITIQQLTLPVINTPDFAPVLRHFYLFHQ